MAVCITDNENREDDAGLSGCFIDHGSTTGGAHVAHITACGTLAQARIISTLFLEAFQIDQLQVKPTGMLL